MGTKKDSTFVAEKITLGMPKNIVEPKYSDEEMKLRDSFALALMKEEIKDNSRLMEDIASWSYGSADLMMEARKEGLND